MKSIIPNNKQIREIEYTRRIKNRHYTMRFICLILLISYIAIWYQYSSSNLAIEYSTWIKIGLSTAMIGLVQFVICIFSFSGKWLKGGAIGILLMTPYILLFLSLPKTTPKTTPKTYQNNILTNSNHNRERIDNSQPATEKNLQQMLLEIKQSSSMQLELGTRNKIENFQKAQKNLDAATNSSLQ